MATNDLFKWSGILSALLIAAVAAGCARVSPEFVAQIKPQSAAKTAELSPVERNLPWALRLSKLAPLTKPHWAWPVRRDDDWYDNPQHRAIALQLARICGSWGIGALHWMAPVNHEHWKQGIALAAEAGVSVNVEISPYGREFATPDPNPCLRNDLYQLAITRFAENLATVKSWCDDAEVPIALVMFDHELFFTTHDSRHDDIRDTPAGARWDSCIEEKLAAFDRIARELVPDAKLVWYGAPNKARGQGWFESPRCDYYMPSLYYPACRWGEKNHLAYWASRTLGIWVTWRPKVTWQIPCISLASGYDLKDGKRYWRRDWDYHVSVSFELGRWLSRADQLDSVYFYPAPSPGPWLKHFESYVRGCNSVVAVKTAEEPESGAP